MSHRERAREKAVLDLVTLWGKYFSAELHRGCAATKLSFTQMKRNIQR